MSRREGDLGAIAPVLIDGNSSCSRHILFCRATQIAVMKYKSDL